MTDFIPYTYRIFHRPTKKYYYGSKTSDYKYRKANPITFWKDYFTSSKVVHQLIEDYGTHTFEIQRIKTFKTKEAALEWESKFLQRINAARRSDWINLHNNDKKWVTPIGHEVTQKTREKISKSHLGLKPSEETRKKLSKSRKLRIISKETRQKMSKSLSGENNPMFGIHLKHSEEAKKKISEAMKGKIPWNKGLKTSKN